MPLKINTKHDQTIRYSCYSNTQYIILRLNLSLGETDINTRVNMKIKNFDPNQVKIPGIIENFKLKSIIVHEQWSARVGHYTCIVRNEKGGWLNISDSSCTSVKQLDKNMKNYFILLIEKDDFIPQACR